VTSVAVVDGTTVVDEGSHDDPRAHAEVIGTLVERHVLPHVRTYGVDAVVCGIGPGPYSGLRVGVAFARGLALAWNVPVVGVCSLDVVAYMHDAYYSDAHYSDVHYKASAHFGLAEGEVLGVTMDARRREWYWALYQSGVRIAGPRVSGDPQSQTSGAVTWSDHHVPSASAAGLFALSQGPLVTPDPLTVTWDDHGDAGHHTEAALRGRTLLPALPLYVRKADVTMSERITRPQVEVMWT